MIGFVLCLTISIIEWFLVSKRTLAISRDSAMAGIIVAIEVAFGLGAGYIIFVQQNILAIAGCAIGAGIGVDLARRRKRNALSKKS